MAKSKYQIEAEQAKADLETFKQKVVKTVLEFQPEYELCNEGVEAFFDEMGLTKLVPPSEKEFIIKIKVSGDRGFDVHSAEEWACDHINSVRDYGTDWDKTRAEVVTVSAS